MYARFRKAIEGRPLPTAIVDLDAVDQNIRTLLTPVERHKKTLRIASKSVRCPALLEYIIDKGAPHMKGVMAYAASEASYLASRGFDDILIAYPTANKIDAAIIARANESATVSAMVDCVAHLDVLTAAAKDHDTVIPVVIDADMSFRPVGSSVHIGVRRSPLHDVESIVALAQKILDMPRLRFLGVMGYEAQIAGLGDASPFAPMLNPAKRWIKKVSKSDVARARRKIRDALEAAGVEVNLFNGGGTGSLHWCSEEDALTEVTAGSGFLQSHLFDYYRDLSLNPAAFFALQAVRAPAPGIITCHGGGFIASGEAGPDKLPIPFLPQGLELTKVEGAGEVQTPLTVPDDLEIQLGDPIFFRHAKAGELAEHFKTYLLIRGDEVVDEVPTYRGEGQCFL